MGKWHSCFMDIMECKEMDTILEILLQLTPVIQAIGDCLDRIQGDAKEGQEPGPEAGLCAEVWTIGKQMDLLSKYHGSEAKPHVHLNTNFKSVNIC